MAKKRSKRKKVARSAVIKNMPAAKKEYMGDTNNCICFSSLHPIHLGLALGLTWGAAIFAMASMGIDTGANTFVGLIFNQYVSMPTAMAGGLYSLIYGFMDGFFGGLIIGSLYNKLNKNCTLC